MKITYIVIAVLLIIGAGVIVVKRDSNKDMSTDTNSNVVTGGGTTTTTTGTSTSSVSNQVSVSTNGSSNVTTGNGAHVTNSDAVDWEGKYQIVEFGKIVPDSNPMRYDAYAYTDITVKKQNTEYVVSIVLTNDTNKKTLEGRGVVNAAGVLEVYSPEQSLLFTLETYESDRVNADTKFTWVNLKSQLNDGAGDIYFMKRKDL